MGQFLGPTISEAVRESHHMHRHSASIGTVEHPLLCQPGVKRNLPEALEVKSIQKHQTGLVSQRPRGQEVWDGAWGAKHREVNTGLEADQWWQKGSSETPVQVPAVWSETQELMMLTAWSGWVKST